MRKVPLFGGVRMRRKIGSFDMMIEETVCVMI
jgi:hypothetical protein